MECFRLVLYILMKVNQLGHDVVFQHHNYVTVDVNFLVPLNLMAKPWGPCLSFLTPTVLHC